MTGSRLSALVGDDYVRAIDAFFDAWDAASRALVAGDAPCAVASMAQAREAMSLWLALLVERVDGRTASMLADALRRIDALERRQLDDLDDPDDPTGFDAGRRP